MSERDNQGEGRKADIPEEIKLNSAKGQTPAPQTSNADRILEEIQSLRSSVETLKKGIDVMGTVNDPNADKVVKVLKEEELSGASSDARAEESSDFAAKYKEQMKQQMGMREAEKVSANDRALLRDEARRKREAQREAIRRAKEAQREELRKERERQRELRILKKAENRQKRIEEEEARRKERRARAKELQKKREIRAEVRRQKKLAAKSAKLGGGVVETYDTQISTEIKPVAKYSFKDLLGIKPRQKLKAAQTEEERKALLEEHETKTIEARQAASHLRRVKQTNFRNSAFGQQVQRVLNFSEKHKKSLLVALSMAILISLGVAGFINYYTVLEYSYKFNEKKIHHLGYVKNRDDVYRVTSIVQKAISKDRPYDVVEEVNDDIVFKRVSTLKKKYVVDNSDDVLKRLTYMGDLNVEAWGIFVNGEKEGSVWEKEDVVEVRRKLEERYASGKKGAKIEKVQILEEIKPEKDNTELSKVYTSDKMVDILCSDKKKETPHTVAAGETLSDIATVYQTTEKKILEDNERLDPTKIAPGDVIVIKQVAPPVTVIISEKRDYEKTIKYETQEKKTAEMYEDEEEVQQEGKNGKEEISERYVSINGKINKDEIEELGRKVIKKPVPKIVLKGTTERPPSVGDGVYIWPIESGYTLTSRFGHRWGRLHAGIDLGTRVGNDVLAADGGIVTRAGYFGGYGLCVDIDHQNGQSTRYGHLSQTLVSVGDEVYEGQHIAESGNTGFSTGAHLHFEIHINGSPTDPLGYLP